MNIQVRRQTVGQEGMCFYDWISFQLLTDDYHYYEGINIWTEFGLRPTYVIYNYWQDNTHKVINV